MRARIVLLLALASCGRGVTAHPYLLLPDGSIPIQYSLTVRPTGSGHGHVTAPDLIDCVSGGAGCTVLVDAGTVVTLSADPDAESLFDTWGGDCTGAGACVLRMDRDHTVEPSFLAAFPVTVSASGPGRVTGPNGLACGAGSSNCTVRYAAGLPITLTATPTTPAEFGGWSGGCTGTAPTCELVVDGPKSINSMFTPRYSLNVRLVADITCSPAPDGTIDSDFGGLCGATPCTLACVMRSGTTDPNSTCSVSFTAGRSVTLTAYPGTQSLFGGWADDCTGSNTSCTLVLDRDRTVTATFCQLIQ